MSKLFKYLTKTSTPNPNVAVTLIPTQSDSGIDTSDANATANDLAKYKTAYVNGEKIEGILNEDSGQWIQQAESASVNSNNLVLHSNPVSENQEFIARAGYEQQLHTTPDMLKQVGLTPEKIK